MYNFIRRVLKKIIMSLPQKYILLESKPDYADSAMSLYNYIVNSDIGKKYTPVWVIDDKSNYNRKYKSLVFSTKFFDSLLRRYYFLRAAAIVFGNVNINKTYERQKSVFLTHGSKSKDTVDKYRMPENLDYILIQANMFKETAKKGYSLSDHTKMITLGFPRNDDLLLPNEIDRQKIFNKKFNKLIVWYPTFRQHKGDGRNVSSISLPVIHSEEAALAINEKAKKMGILIALKPHFAQDVSFIKNNNLSNIIIFDDEFLKKKNIRSYQLLSLADSLLTDYSSVYYDYLLCDRPIGLVWEDYEEYKKGQGFALDPDIVYSGGEKIFNVEDFCAYLERIANGEDILREERTKIKNLSNVYQDANSSKRVAEFIINLIESN